MNTVRIALIIIVTLLAAAKFAVGQCDHESARMSRFNQGGYFAFVARNYDGSRIEWTWMDDQGNYADTLLVDAKTKLPMGFAKTYKDNIYWAIYSKCDKVAELITEPSPEQLKVFRKQNPK